LLLGPKKSDKQTPKIEMQVVCTNLRKFTKLRHTKDYSFTSYSSLLHTHII